MAVKTKTPLAVRMYQTAVWDFKEQPYPIPQERENVHREGLDSDELVVAHDRILLHHLREYLDFAKKYYQKTLNSDPLQDDPSQPLEKWWWHLNRIARGEFPEDKLPQHLREIYREKYLKK
ncbi:hypothetical protein [Hydrogenivirga sp. 128-5-R1-1]|uniref:hypothetical protein n=1 Tax=Hydrogenivirga sp. 128-5-R1-1 TaxID=392423 RepID=UPI000315DE4B|nr:hypothetical protein [Hydrogenivirga sp. 128-5-R1-1]